MMSSNSTRIVLGAALRRTNTTTCYKKIIVPSVQAAAATTTTTTTTTTRRFAHVEKRLAELGIELPPPPAPKANYNIACHASGNMMYISGHLPIQADGTLMTGRIGPDNDDDNGESQSSSRSVEYGYEAARHCGLNLISTMQSQLGGDLDRVEQIVKVFGIVNSTVDFKSHHLVVDGCSDVLMEVFGKPVGYHARSAIGTSTLPLDMSVEVECIIQIKK